MWLGEVVRTVLRLSASCIGGEPIAKVLLRSVLKLFVR